MMSNSGELSDSTQTWLAREKVRAERWKRALALAPWLATDYNEAAGNACRGAGLTTEALEKGVVAWLIEQARGREWLPLRGMESYCPECAHSPAEYHAPSCERGGFYAALGPAEVVQP